MSVIRQLKSVLGIESEEASFQNIDSLRLSSDFVEQSEYAMNLLGYVQTGQSIDLVGITEENFRKHLTVFGQTGFGRETLLQNSLYQLINNDQGVCLIDRTGRTVESLSELVPKSKKDDFVVVKPGNTSESVGFNFFEVSKELGDKKFEKDVEYIISEFTKLTELDEGTRMEEVTEVIVSQLLYSEESHSPEDFQKIISSTDDVKNFVDSFEDQLSEDEEELLLTLSEDDLEPIQRRVVPFVENSSVSTVTGHDSTSMTISEAVEDNMSILVSLGDIEDEIIKEYVAASVTRQVWAAIQKRSYMGSDKYDAYSLALSEFGEFESERLGFDEILPKARSFGLSVLVSVQHPEELTEKSINSIQNNCLNTVSTRIGSDADVVANMLSVEDETDLMSLDKYQFIGTVSVHDGNRKTTMFQGLRPLQ